MASIYKRGGKGRYIIAFFDQAGKRHERSSRTTDYKAAERIANKLEAGVALRRDGVIDARQDRFGEENRKPLAEHVQDYLEHCRHVGHAPRHITEKIRHLEALLEETRATRLSEWTADVVEGHLRTVKDRGYSARTVNFRRQVAVAFLGWCKRTGRVESNPLSVIPKLDEARDRRRVRRPLTDDELVRLLTVAEPRGRKPWYLAAVLAGLRRSELRKLTWADVDAEQATITIRDGKAKREDVIPMHPQLADALRAIRPTAVDPRARVFPAEPTNLTRAKDFLRAGLARTKVVADGRGEPIIVGKGKRARPMTRIVTEDAEGRTIDLHALRTTLGTRLARSGTAPQIAQRIMRHSDYRTTLKHYTVLGLSDTASAICRLARVESAAPVEAAAATGTDGARPVAGRHRVDPQQIHQQSGRSSQRSGAKRCESDATGCHRVGKRKTRVFAAGNDDLRPSAKQYTTAGDATRTRNVQLGRLMLYH